VTFDEVKNKFIDCCLFANIDAPEEVWNTISNSLDYDLLNKLPLIHH
jgi:hypothetical protein